MKTASVITLILGLSAAFLQAQTVPGLISYQGKVVDSSGIGLGTGTPINRKILFRLFDGGTGGNRLWSEEQTVTLSNGDFSVILGQGIGASYNGSPENPRPSLLTVFAGTDRYLELVVDGGDGAFTPADTPITPRQRLISTAFAVRAATADGIASGTDFNLRDANHGLGWFGTGKPFNGINPDGPVLYGFNGGALGSVSGATQNIALRWTSSGNVGIGTASPAEKLDVVGNAKISGTITATGDITSGASIKANGNNGFVFNATGDTDGGMFSPADGVVTFRTNGVERARIDANGNLGVANNNPTEKLDVTGNIKASGNASITGTTTTGSLNVSGSASVGGLAFPSSGGVDSAFVGTAGNSIAFGTQNNSEDFIGFKNNIFYFRDSPGGGDAIQPSIDVGGGITAGTAISTPGDITSGNYSGGDRFIHVRSQGNNLYRSGINFHHFNGTYGWSVFSDERTTDGYGFHIDSIYSGTVTNRFFIEVGGNTGIGTKAPTEKLEVVGNIKATGKVTANDKTAVVGEEELRLVRGTVSNLGAPLRGGGFTSNWTGYRYIITFSTAFSFAPSVVATANVDDAFSVTAYDITTTGFKVRTNLTDNKDDKYDREFSFIAAGPR